MPICAHSQEYQVKTWNGHVFNIAFHPRPALQVKKVTQVSFIQLGTGFRIFVAGCYPVNIMGRDRDSGKQSFVCHAEIAFRVVCRQPPFITPEKMALLTCPGFILAGHFTKQGALNPPSQVVAFSPLKGVIPPAGQNTISAPLSVPKRMISIKSADTSIIILGNKSFKLTLKTSR